MAASVLGSPVFVLFLFVFPVFCLTNTISFTRDELLNIRQNTPQDFVPDFNYSDVLLNVVIGGAAALIKRFRTRRRGKRAGALVRLRKRGFQTPLPSIHLANLRSLPNKTDELLLLSRTNKDFSHSAALCFTETWLNDTIPDSALHLPGFQLFRADRDAESTGKSRGGGTCFYINERWCRDVTVLKKMCCPDLEMQFVNCKPFYSPQEFHSFILVSVYIPPQAHVSSTLQKLADQITDTEQQHPDSVLIILGDFNKANLSRELPKYTDGDHKNHNTVSLEETELMIQDTQQMIQDRIKKIEDIKHSAEVRHRSTQKDKTACIELFTDLIRSIERHQTEQLEMMEEKQKAPEKQKKELIEELEQEITELKMRNIKLQQLSHTEDVIQIYSSLSSLRNTRNWPEISVKTHENLETLRRALTQLKDTIDEKLDQTNLKWMQQYAVDVTLDPDTAHPFLILSDDGKQVRHGDIRQKLPDKPERFDYCACVLGKEGFSSGRFYFEVQVKGKTYWESGVVRESINRKRQNIASPSNGCWIVNLMNGNVYNACAGPHVSLSPRVKPQRVGVFVDYEEGLVSFYDAESRSHIYSFTAQSFTGKLYPYFNPCFNDGGKNIGPLIISAVSYGT